MPENKNRRPVNDRAPAFSVQDEIKRNKRLRMNKKVREARGIANKFFIVSLLALIIALFAAAILFAVMRVETLSVSGNIRYTADDILEAANVNGAVLPFVNREKVEERIISEYPYVNSVELVKKYPSTLEIVIAEAEAIYVIDVRGKQYALDADLRVIDSIGSGELIELILPEVSSAEEGKKIVFYDSANNDRIPKMLDKIFTDENTLPLTKLDLSSRFFISGAIGNEVKILFGSYEKIPLKLKAANIYIEKARSEKSARTLVDVSPLDSGGTPGIEKDYKGEF